MLLSEVVATAATVTATSSRLAKVEALADLLRRLPPEEVVLTVGFLSALVTTAGYMALGYWIGEPAVQAVDTYGRYLWYVSIAILVGMLAVFWYRQKKADAAVSTQER